MSAFIETLGKVGIDDMKALGDLGKAFGEKLGDSAFSEIGGELAGKATKFSEAIGEKELTKVGFEEFRAALKQGIVDFGEKLDSELETTMTHFDTLMDDMEKLIEKGEKGPGEVRRAWEYFKDNPIKSSAKIATYATLGVFGVVVVKAFEEGIGRQDQKECKDKCADKTNTKQTEYSKGDVPDPNCTDTNLTSSSFSDCAAYCADACSDDNLDARRKEECSGVFGTIGCIGKTAADAATGLGKAAVDGMKELMDMMTSLSKFFGGFLKNAGPIMMYVLIGLAVLFGLWILKTFLGAFASSKKQAIVSYATSMGDSARRAGAGKTNARVVQ